MSTSKKYMQIKNYYKDKIQLGSLPIGSKLPTERELCEKFSVSRGTAKKALVELSNLGIVDIKWGNGAYVSDFKKSNNNVFTSTISDLKSLDYTDFEIERTLSIHTKNLLYVNNINIAAIDCNIEALMIYKSQFFHEGDINYVPFLLTEVLSFKNPELLFSNFDIIFTTGTHYDDLINIMPSCEDKIIRAAVSPDSNTLVNLFKANKEDNVAILTKSYRFDRIIRHNIGFYDFNVADSNSLLEAQLDELDFSNFIKDKDVLIIPPLYALNLKSDVYYAIINFAQSQGKLLTFNYSIEKGSLIHMDERIRSFKNKN